MWKNILEPDWPQMTIWHMRIACRIPKAADTHSECVILFFFTEKVVARTRRIFTLRLYVACLVVFAADFKFCPPTHLISNGLTTYLSPRSYLLPRLKVTELHVTPHTNIRGQRELHILVFLSVLLVGPFDI